MSIRQRVRVYEKKNNFYKSLFSVLLNITEVIEEKTCVGSVPEMFFDSQFEGLGLNGK